MPQPLLSIKLHSRLQRQNIACLLQPCNPVSIESHQPSSRLYTRQQPWLPNPWLLAPGGSFATSPLVSLARRQAPAHGEAHAAVAASMDDSDSSDVAAESLAPFRTVKKSKKDWNVEYLLNMKYRKDILNLAPEYQRGFVWSAYQSSYLILTILQNLLVPAIILHEQEDARLDVMDGRQRLTSIISFIEGKQLHGQSGYTQIQLPPEEDDPKLLRYVGKTFEQLSKDEQDRILNYELWIMVIEAGTDPQAIFNMHLWLNKAGVNYTPQQARRSAFHGPYIKQLDTLAQNELFKKMTNLKQDRLNKEYDCELILRYFALQRHIENKDMAAWKNMSLKQFLTKEISDHRFMRKELLIDLSKQFDTTLKNVWPLFGKEAFLKDRRFSELKWDTIMLGMSNLKYSKAEVSSKADMIRSAFTKLWDTFEEENLTIAKRTQTVKRHALFKEMLETTLGKPNTSPRAVPPKLREHLLNNNMLKYEGLRCELCKNKILDTRDAEVDHVMPYSLGGSTEAANLQILCISCNRTKSNKIIVLPAS